ncbi:hypothetical protein LguiA_002311 [Lonicera macranthoides]
MTSPPNTPSKTSAITNSPNTPSSSQVDKSPFLDPYYLHPSDSPGMVLITEILDGDNFSNWQRAMSMALNSKNKLGFVNGSIVAPAKATDPELFCAWSRCNDMVYSWILNTVTKEIRASIIRYSTAHQAWEDLSERFSQQNAPRIFEIQREIASFRQDQLTVSAYYTKLKGLWDELSALDSTLGTQIESQKLMQFLMGLNESYQAVRSQLLLTSPIPTVRQAYSSISQEEKQRSISASLANDSISSAAAMAVNTSDSGSGSVSRFASRSNDYKKQQTREQSRYTRGNEADSRIRQAEQGQRRDGSEKRRPYCPHCNQLGHQLNKCWELYGYPAGHPKAKFNSGAKKNNNKIAINTTSATVTVSEDDYQKFLLWQSSQNEASGPKINTVANSGSGNEEDDWFG